MSGFANTAGGVLVWGIEARKNPAGVDAAHKVTYIASPSAFRTRLVELQRDATDPPVQGVDIREYVDASAHGKGFVVCLVPEGGFKPYRAEIRGHEQYYIRVGDSFRVPNRALLRSLFYPQVRAALQIDASLQCVLMREGPREDQAYFRCDIRIQNAGPATAKDAQIIFALQQHPNCIVAHNWNGEPHWESCPMPQKLPTALEHFAMRARRALHPGVMYHLATLTWYTPTIIVSDGSHRVVPQLAKFAMKLRMYAENMEPQVLFIEFDTRNMEERKSLDERGVAVEA